MQAEYDPHLEYRRYAENVMILDRNEVRYDGNGHSYRYRMAEGMLEVLDHMAHKRLLRREGEERAEQKEVARMKREVALASKLLDKLEVDLNG